MWRSAIRIGLTLSIGVAAVLVPAGIAQAAEPDYGHPGPTYATGSGSPSGSKPQSKLWHAAGSWWAVMWDDDTADSHIFRLDTSNQAWVDTGVLVDNRKGTRVDVLWDGSTLYVASHQYTSNASRSGTARLYTFLLNGSTWAQQGSPSTINNLRTETLVIGKDSVGDLWATWVETTSSSGTVKLARRPAGQSTWDAPFTVPGADANVSADDISSLIHDGTGIAVLWSDQDSARFGFARHVDGTSAGTWTTETAATGASIVDDHISLATQGGQIYALVKGGDDGLRMLHRAANGSWSTPTTVWDGSASTTRGIVMIDAADQLLRAYATGPTPPASSGQAGGTIYEKTGPLSTRSFPGGVGTPIIQDADVGDMNNATGTKQTLDGSTGVVVVATQDHSPRRYWHHHAPLSGTPPTTTTTSTTTTTTTTTTVPTTTTTTTTTTVPTTTTTTTTTVPTTTTTTTTAPPSEQTFISTADAHVRSSSTNKNYGSITSLRIRDSSTSYRAHFAFDVAGLAPGMTSAVLRLYVDNASPDGGSVHTVAEAWDESTITWGNAPTPSGSPIANAGRTPSAGQWMEVDVSAAISGDGTYRFVLESSSSNSAFYSSREGANPPQLVFS